MAQLICKIGHCKANCFRTLKISSDGDNETVFHMNSWFIGLFFPVSAEPHKTTTFVINLILYAVIQIDLSHMFVKSHPWEEHLDIYKYNCI